MTSQKDELEKIKKLPPKERVKKLKELEEKRKKEDELRQKDADEAKKLLEASLEAAKTEELIEEAEVPDGNVDLEQLFEQENQDELEQKVAEERKREEETRAVQELQNQYNSEVDRLTSYDTYNNLQRWVQQSIDGELPEEYEGVVVSMYGEINKMQQFMRTTSTYESSSQTLEKLDSAKQMLKKIGYNSNIFHG
jgi:hypothetical protein